MNPYIQILPLILLLLISNIDAKNVLGIGVDNQLPTPIVFGEPTNPVCMYGCTGKDQEGPYGYNDAYNVEAPCHIPETGLNNSINIPKNSAVAFTIAGSEHIGGCYHDDEPSSFQAAITLNDGSQLPFTFSLNKENGTWRVIDYPLTLPSPLIGGFKIQNNCKSYPLNKTCVYRAGCNIEHCINITLSPPLSKDSEKKK